jgi:ABC-2 type transport system permease protein
MASTRATTRRAGSEALPIFTLSLRQFIGGKAIRVVLLFTLLPALFALIYALETSGVTAREFIDDLFQEFVAPTVLPIATLILATNAIGNEIEDRTMAYLVLKPLSRARIILEKYLAVVVATTLLLWEGLLLTFLIAMRGDAGDNLDQLVALLVGGLAGVLAYAALFMCASLIVPRALLAGIIYSLLWETTFARFIPGVRLISVRHFVLSIYGRLLDNDAFLIDNAMQLVAALLTILALVVVALVGATFRLRTMNLE